MSLEIKDAAELRWIFDTGHTLQGQKIAIKDAMATTNAPMFFKKVISNIVREAAEPLLVGTSLLKRINLQFGQQISFPAVGAMTASDIGEGQEYPEQSLSMGGGTVVSLTGKSGIAVRVTDEMVANSQFDVISMLLQGAGRAMARHKEVKIFNYIRSGGVPVFDNLEPANSMYGVMTGRNIGGIPNGSLTMDDLFDGFAQVMQQGFMPDTLLMHPLTWVMFIKDPIMRAFIQANGVGTYFASWRGNPASKAGWDTLGGLGVSGGQLITQGTTPLGADAPHSLTASKLLDFPQDINSAPELPTYFNVPFRIIVSPYVPFDPARRLTDIYMFDSAELGVLAVGEDLTVEEFDDPARDIKKIKMRERYAIGILNEGLAVAVFRNVHCVPNEVVLPAQATIDISSTVQRIAPDHVLAI